MEEEMEARSPARKTTAIKKSTISTPQVSAVNILPPSLASCLNIYGDIIAKA